MLRVVIDSEDHFNTSILIKAIDSYDPKHENTLHFIEEYKSRGHELATSSFSSRRGSIETTSLSYPSKSVANLATHLLHHRKL